VALSSLEESQEGGEWAIRVGDAPPPAWGKKRSLSQEDTLEGDPKRKRVDSGYVFRFCHSVPAHPRPTPSLACHLYPLYLVLIPDSFYQFSLEHHNLVEEIAAAYQFTPSEVGAYYFRVNQDLERTRRRFEKARKLLDDMSDVE